MTLIQVFRQQAGHGKISQRSCEVHCIYLFIYLFFFIIIIYLFIYFDQIKNKTLFGKIVKCISSYETMHMHRMVVALALSWRMLQDFFYMTWIHYMFCKLETAGQCYFVPNNLKYVALASPSLLGCFILNMCYRIFSVMI